MKKSKKNKTKIGRNDPCYCGSGRKYKKCCLNKYRDARLKELTSTAVEPKKSISIRPITPVDMRSFQAASEILKRLKER